MFAEMFLSMCLFYLLCNYLNKLFIYDYKELDAFAVMKKTGKKHIDDVQPDSVEKHFDLIVNDESFIENEYSKITINDLPEWFDEELFKRGQNYYRSNLLGMNNSYTNGLIAVFLVPTISKILIFTKQSSTTCSAFRRYFQTLLHVHNLHMNEVTDPKSKFYKSINTIRWKHSVSSKRSEDSKNKGISQRDMVVTQLGFVMYVLLHPEHSSLTNEPSERQGFNHFWRVIGHLLSIPEKLNLCRRNEFETTQLCKKLKDEFYVKELKQPTSHFMTLIIPTLEGFKCIDPLLDSDALLVGFYKLNDSKYDKQLSLKSRLLLAYKNAIFYLIQTPIIGVIVRVYWNYYLRFNIWFSEKYPIFAWIKFGKQNSKLKLFPHSF